MKILLIFVSCFVFTACLKTRSEISDVEEKKQAQQITAIQQQRADQESRVNDIEATLRQINGRLEAIEHRLNLDYENKQKELSSSAAIQKQMIDQMKLFEENLNRIEARLSEVESRPSAVAAPPVNKGTSNKDSNHPSYMEAENFFNSKEWKKAAFSYEKYRSENPKGKNFADATYKIGVCFQEMGKNAEAKVFFDEVLEKFPKSATARKAQYRIKNLK